MEEKVRCGIINCSCGQQCYFETINTSITCIKCKKLHDITSYPEKVEGEINNEEYIDEFIE